MKLPDLMKTFLIAAFLISGICLFSQSAADYDARLNPIQSYQRNNPSYLYQKPASQSETVEVARSDMGIQRPIEAKKTGFGYHLGFSTRLYYSNNPGSADSPSTDNQGRPLVDAGAVWDNSLNNTFLLGSYDLGGSTFTPIIGLSYLKNSNFGSDVHDSFDFDMLNLNFAGIFQIGRTWTIRPNLRYNHFLGDSGFGLFAPSLALGKSFKIFSARSFVDWSLGFSMQDNDTLNKFQSAWTWGINIPVGNLEISPYLRFAYLNYYNDDRTDFKTDLGLNFDYSLTNWMKISTFISYANNSSDKTGKDFSRFDLGAGTAFTAKF